MLLLARQHRCFGEVVVDRVEGDLVFGDFIPEPNFAEVGSLFSEYLRAANQQLLSDVGGLDIQIEALGLHLRSDNVAYLAPIYDVQIGEGGINFRVQPQVTNPIGMRTPPEFMHRSHPAGRERD